MILNSFFLAISSSVDSLGIGITYGLKKTKISYVANIILFSISIIITTFSMWFGNCISNFLSSNITNVIGSLIIIFMGFFMTFQALKKNNVDNCNGENLSFNENINDEKIFCFFIKFLGITIQIIRNPTNSDFDQSKKIDCKEAFFLAIALSLDSFCIGIGSTIAGISSSLFPLLISTFQLLFLKFGYIIGRKLNNTKIFPDNTWSVLSGILLIIIGFVKFF